MSGSEIGHRASGVAAAATIDRTDRLVHLPLPLFAATMGIAGLGLAWREAHRTFGVPEVMGEALLLLAGLVYLATFLLHAIRALRHPEALAADLRHPVRLMFAGAVSIGIILLAGGLLPHHRDAADLLWIGGVFLHLLIGVLVLQRLLTQPGNPVVLAPPLLIPLVGNILAPVFGAQLGHQEASWMLFGVGTVLWIMVQPAIMHRLLAGPELPARLRPTLAILLAPPAVGVLALTSLTGGAIGPVHLGLYGAAALIAVLLLALVPAMATAPFAMSWWGWTFPAAAFATATMVILRALAPPGAGVVMAAVLALATLVVALVCWRTARGLIDGALLRAEG